MKCPHCGTDGARLTVAHNADICFTADAETGVPDGEAWISVFSNIDYQWTCCHTDDAPTDAVRDLNIDFGDPTVSVSYRP